MSYASLLAHSERQTNVRTCTSRVFVHSPCARLQIARAPPNRTSSGSLSPQRAMLAIYRAWCRCRGGSRAGFSVFFFFFVLLLLERESLAGRVSERGGLKRERRWWWRGDKDPIVSPASRCCGDRRKEPRGPIYYSKRATVSRRRDRNRRRRRCRMCV